MNDDDVFVSSSLFDADVSVLVNAVADYAANSSTRFDTGVLQLAEGKQSQPKLLFGLAQCTLDIAPADCRICLANILALGFNLISGRKAGTVHCGLVGAQAPYDFCDNGTLLIFVDMEERKEGRR